MAKRESKMAIKLLKWHTHHEPHRLIHGPLTYFLERVHAGGGRDKLIENIGLTNGGQAIAFFDWLLRRTAKLPRKWRGYVLDGDHKPMTDAQVAREYGASDVRVRGWVKALGDVGWLGRRPLRRLLGKPSDALTKNENEGEKNDIRHTTNERRVTPKKPADYGGLDSRRREDVPTGTVSPSSSPRPVETKRAAFERLAKRFNRDANVREHRADLTLIQRVIDHHSQAGKTCPSIERVYALADKAASSTSARNKLALWQSFLRTEGLHYRNFQLRLTGESA